MLLIIVIFLFYFFLLLVCNVLIIFSCVLFYSKKNFFWSFVTTLMLNSIYLKLLLSFLQSSCQNNNQISWVGTKIIIENTKEFWINKEKISLIFKYFNKIKAIENLKEFHMYNEISKCHTIFLLLCMHSYSYELLMFI